MKNNELPLYQPPRARDLSASSVSGLGPLGQCYDGSGLTFEICSGGPTPEGGSCSPTGIIPDQGYCDTGNLAVEGCLSGTQHF